MSVLESPISLSEDAIVTPSPSSDSTSDFSFKSEENQHSPKSDSKKHKKKKSSRSERPSRSMHRTANDEGAFVDGSSVTNNLASPSSVAGSRRHSPVIKTSDESSHELSEGRESILVAASASSSSTSSLRASLLSPIRLPKMCPRADLERSKSDVLTDSVSHFSTEYLTVPHPLRLDAWAEPPGTNFQVRGPQYLQDSVKVESKPSMFQLLTVDMVKVDAPIMTGLCSHPKERIQLAMQRERETGKLELPAFIFCINLVIPGKSMYHVVFYFGIDDVSLLTDVTTPFGRVASRFFFGRDDAFRDRTFKLIPRIVEGNFIVRKAVGSKPAILGRKICQTYIRTPRYMELIVDIASESVAAKIVNLSIGYAKTLAVDMAFVLEATEANMLPEQILGVVRLKQIDFKNKDGQRKVEAVS